MEILTRNCMQSDDSAQDTSIIKDRRFGWYTREEENHFIELLSKLLKCRNSVSSNKQTEKSTNILLCPSSSNNLVGKETTDEDTVLIGTDDTSGIDECNRCEKLSSELEYTSSLESNVSGLTEENFLESMHQSCKDSFQKVIYYQYFNDNIKLSFFKADDDNADFRQFLLSKAAKLKKSKDIASFSIITNSKLNITADLVRDEIFDVISTEDIYVLKEDDLSCFFYIEGARFPYLIVASYNEMGLSDCIDITEMIILAAVELNTSSKEMNVAVPVSSSRDFMRIFRNGVFINVYGFIRNISAFGNISLRHGSVHLNDLLQGIPNVLFSNSNGDIFIKFLGSSDDNSESDSLNSKSLIADASNETDPLPSKLTLDAIKDLLWSLSRYSRTIASNEKGLIEEPEKIPHDSATFAVSKKKTINDFRISEKVGHGAYGHVVVAKNLNEDTSVVLKFVVKKRIRLNTWVRDKTFGTLPLEIHILRRIRNFPHPNVLLMSDFFEDDRNYYIEMPHFGSSTMDLFDYIELKANLEEIECKQLFCQIAEAIHHLHDVGIVHRDIKDENIVLDEHGRVILVDFGSAAYVKDGPFDVFMGTIDYASPEVLAGNKYDGRPQDVWAAGILLHTMAFGEIPFYNAEEILKKDIKISAEFSKEFVEVISFMLNKEVVPRPTMEQILHYSWLLKT